MPQVSTYLFFDRTCAKAFDFYKSVFGGEFTSVTRYGDMPAGEGQQMPPPDQADLIINIQLPIMDGHLLMGSDAVEGMGPGLVVGDNFSICLHPATREDADRLYGALSVGGQATMPMAEQFWGDYYGQLVDKFSINWMISHAGKRG